MKKRTILLAPLFLLVSMLCIGSAHANLLVNSSFEEGDFSGANNSYKRLLAGDGSLTGWTIGGTGVDWHNTGEMRPHADGGKVIDFNLNGGGDTGTISQSFSTTQGAWYRLSFSLAGPQGETWFPDPRTIRVNIDGSSQTFSQAASNPTSLIWGIKEWQFQALSANTTLTFSSVNGAGYWGPVLDAVSVNPVPVPGALWLFAPALAGFVGLRRRFLG
jgi:choice-of-anchor C domain-containing protein